MRLNRPDAAATGAVATPSDAVPSTGAARSRRRGRVVRIGAVVIALGFVAVFPQLMAGSPYWILIATLMGIYVICTAGFRYIVTCGEYSFGHVAIMGMGGYLAAILMTRFGLSFWLSLPIAIAGTILIATVVYYPCLRTTGVTFFFSSFAFAEIMRLCWSKFPSVFGGSSGLFNIPRPSALSVGGLQIVFNKPPYANMYYLVVICVVVVVCVLYFLEKSRLGAVATALATSRTLSRFIGIRIWRNEMVFLLVGSAVAGLAGVLYASQQTLLMPYTFYWTLSIDVTVWAVVGGVRHWMGPIVGVVCFTLLSELLRPFPELVPFLYGLILALTLVFLPDGLVSLPREMGRLYGRMRSRASVPEGRGEQSAT